MIPPKPVPSAIRCCPSLTRRWMGRALLVAASTGLVLAAMEGYWRLLPTRRVYYRLMLSSQGPMVQPHPSLLYVNRRGYRGPFNSPLFRTAVRINDRGLRERPIPYAKTGSEKRCLVLGDSFAFGWGVQAEQAVGRALEARLPGVQVLNGGCIGWGTGRQARFLADEGLRYDPDSVVLYFFGNDPTDTLAWERTLGARGGTTPVVAAPPAPTLAARLESFLFDRSAAWIEICGMTNQIKDGPGHPARNSRTLADAWGAAARALRKINGHCRARGIPLLIAMIPDAGAGPRPNGRPVPGPWGARLEQLCRSEGVALLDLYPSLREAARREPVFYPIDGHWTAFGHQVAAQATARQMRELGWVDRGGDTQVAAAIAQPSP